LVSSGLGYAWVTGSCEIDDVSSDSLKDLLAEPLVVSDKELCPMVCVGAIARHCSSFSISLILCPLPYTSLSLPSISV
jgi:hypothetical protein